MMSKDREPRGDGIAYTVVQEVKVDPYLVDVAKKATAAVWQRHVDEPTTMTLRFVPSLAYKGRLRSHNPFGSYHWDPDTISFAVNKITTPDQQGLSDAHKTAMVAGHETMHRVQVHSGETLTPSSEMTQQEYDNDPHERQAEKEGERVFREMYPDAYNWVAHRYVGSVSHRVPIDRVPDRKVTKIYTRQERVIIDLAPQHIILPKNTELPDLITPSTATIQKFSK